jgi:Alginate lyase
MKRLSMLVCAMALSVQAVKPFAMPIDSVPAGTESVSDEFTHPGVLLDNEQLATVRQALAAGREPWTGALAKLQASVLASLDYRPEPWSTVECGPFSKPDHGCTVETNDAQAAYTHALLWAYLGDVRHARKAVEIMNAWAGTLKGGHTESNAPLQASWAGELWPRAAEIIRYTSTEWSAADVDAFALMLRTQYLPDIQRMGVCHTANWQASGIEATANIAIFLDDRASFDDAIERWRERVRTSIYLASDGPTPATPATPAACPREGQALIDAWFGQADLRNGHGQETCRDLEHTAYGLAALTNVAETARVQGIDLYGEESTRLTSAMEFHAQWRNGRPTPLWLCKGSLKGDLTGTFEVGYNHYVNRQGMSLPETSRWLLSRRPTQGYFHYLWETLTHAETGTP